MKDMRRWSVPVASVAFLILLLMAVPSFSQSIGTILGVVKDSSGGVVPQATITVVNTDTNETRTATTADDGAFRFPALQPGHYSLRIEKGGFETQTQTGLTLTVAQEMVLNPTLAVGTATQEVTVTGEAPLVNTTNAAGGGLVDEAKIADLPLNGRNYVDLTLMQTGISANSNQTSSNSQGGTRGTYFNADGAPERSNMFMLDGSITTNARGGSPATESGTTLGVDGIKEFKVVTGTYGADYGIYMGGQVIMVSKGGTNQFHGDVFEYIRNSHLDARNFFDYGFLTPGAPRLPRFERNNFGGAVGGPIKKDKLFFFATYEGLRSRTGQTVLDTVPPAGCQEIALTSGTAGTPSGVYNFIASPANAPKAVQGNSALQNAQNCVSSFTAATNVNGVTGNLLLNLFPIANLSNNQYTYPYSSPNAVDFGQLRTDYNLSDKDSLFGRVSSDESLLVSATPGLNATGTSGYQNYQNIFFSKDTWVTLGENHIFSPTVLNSLRVSYSRNNWLETSQYLPYGPVTSVAAYSGPGLSFDQGQPTGDVGVGSGVTAWGPSSTVPQGDRWNNYVLNEDLFYTRGKHALKFGFLGQKNDMADRAHSNDIGSLTFTNLTNFMTGSILGGTQTNGSQVNGTFSDLANNTIAVLDRDYVWYSYGFYIQDDWRITPRLTLNLGLRYEFMTQVNDKYGRQVQLNLESPNTTLPLPFGPEMSPPGKDQFQPRLGFAWDIFGDGKTSLRGGAGRYFDEGGNLPPYLTTSEQAQPGLNLAQKSNNCPATAALPNVDTVLTLPFTYVACDSLFPSITMPGYYEEQQNFYKWNLAVDRQLPGGIGLTVAYTGTRGLHLYRVLDGNPTIPEVVGGSLYVNGTPFWNGVEPRFNTHFAGTGQYQTSSGESNYNSLQVSALKRMSHGLQFQVAYTYAHALDTTANSMGSECGAASGMGVTVPDVTRFAYGPACADIRNNARINVQYNLPSLKSDNFMAKATRGWFLGTIISAQSGYPFTPVLSSNRSNSKETDYANFVTSADVAACTATPAVCPSYTPVVYNPSTVIVGTANEWYNPKMFEQSPLYSAPGVVCTTGNATVCPYGTLGDVSRGFLRGPGLRNVDFSIAKDTRLPILGEAGMVQFRAEFFNILNHANFGMPNGTAITTSSATSAVDAAPTAGVPLASNQIAYTITTSRQIQFALKLLF